jgi:hypothetical protein
VPTGLSFVLLRPNLGIRAALMLIYYSYQLREAARREVNHHVRNAMMVILYSEAADAVEQERKRIDAVLRTWL